MKIPLVLSLIVGTLFFSSGCEIVDPILIALNMPLEVCASINVGNTWNDTATYNIQDEIANISEDYVDEVKATRVNDVTVYMAHPPSSGTASGTIQYALDGGSLVTLATFSSVPFSRLASPGVSITDPTVMTYVPGALAALLSALQDPNGLPPTTTITVRSSGSSTVTVPQGTEICARVHFQADINF